MSLKQFLPLLLILALALTLRLIFLDRIPTGINDDELDYVLNAKAVFLTGKDLSGTWSPFSLTTPPNEFPKAELPYLIMAPFIGIFDFSLFTARLPYALVSVLLILVMYLISYRLFGKNIAFLTGAIMAINPWSVYFGRTSYDTPLSVFFFFLSFYILLIAKKWNILTAFPFLFLAFFSYIGTKILLIPFVIIVVTFVWYKVNKKRYLKQYIALVLLCISVVAFFAFSLQNRALLRTSDLISPNSSKIVNIVDTERRLSIQTPIRELMSNKLVVLGKEAINTYYGSFSPGLLFLYGEYTPFFSLNHGLFYYIDFLLILLGLVYLFKESRSLWFFLVSLILIAPLPSAASSVGLSYSIRSSLLFPLLALLISLGIMHIVSFKKTRLYKVSIISILIISYGVLLTNFMYIYLFRQPVLNSDYSNLSGRVLSRYIDLAKEHNKEVTFIENTNLTRSSLFKQNLFYTNGYNRYTADSIRELIINNSSTYDNLTISPCPNELFPKDSIVILPSEADCPFIRGGDKLIIARLSDGGGIYNITNDAICKKYRLKPYPRDIKLSDFEIEKLSEKKFCETFITRY